MNMFVLWAKPLSDLAEYGLNVTIHKHDCIYSQKGTAEQIPSIILKRVQNARNSLSNERVPMKFGRFFAEILKSEYQEISLWSPYWNLRCFQSEKQKEISIGKCKVSLDLKVGIFNSQNRCKVVVSNELGRQLEHFNWALFRRFIADSHTNPLQSICKSLYLKTETDKTCKIRINADSFSLTKILMKLMQSQ